MSSKTQVDVIYLDFKKAFDSVSHSKLLEKLWVFGITGGVWRWIRAYLMGRVQFVSINGATSDQFHQVSLRAVSSFYDLPDNIMLSKVLMFADDVKCVLPVSGLDDCLKLQSDICKLMEWSFLWKLPLNEMKCHFNSIACDYYLNYSTLSVDTSHRDLGVVFSEDLKWGPHHKLITSRSYKILGLLRRIFTKISCVQSKRVLYITLVKPHLLYCSPLWHPYLLSDIKLLETVQRRATKFIVGDNSLDYKERLLNCNLLPLMMEYEIILSA